MTLLNRWLSGSSIYQDYQQFVQTIIEPLFTRLGVDIDVDEPKLDRYARTLAINLACQAGLPSCLNQTSKKFKEFVAGDAVIAPDLQSAIYCNGLRQGDRTDYEFLLDKMFASKNQGERTLIIAAIGCNQDSDILKEFLDLTVQVKGSKMRLQEKSKILAAPINNGELGLRVLIDFVEKNFEKILEISSPLLNTILTNIASRIASEEIYTKFDTLLSQLESFNATTKSKVETHRVTVNNNLRWQSRNLATIGNWLKNSSGGCARSTVVSMIVMVTCGLIKHVL